MHRKPPADRDHEDSFYTDVGAALRCLTIKPMPTCTADVNAIVAYEWDAFMEFRPHVPFDGMHHAMYLAGK